MRLCVKGKPRGKIKSINTNLERRAFYQIFHDRGRFVYMERAIITVIGKDMRGIIAKVSTLLYENEINILDISQTLMQDMFTMIMLCDISTKKISFSQLVETLDKLGEELGLSIRIQHEDIFNSMHRI